MLSSFQAPNASFIQGQCRHASLEASVALVMLLAWRSGILVCPGTCLNICCDFPLDFDGHSSCQINLSWADLGRLYHAWHVYICLPGLWITVISVWSTACANLLCSTDLSSQLLPPDVSGKKHLTIPLNKQIKCLQNKNAMEKLPSQMY